MLRVANISDLGLVLKMAKKFIDTTDFKDKVREKVLDELVIDTLRNPGAVVLIHSDKGMIAGQVVPFQFTAEPTAVELCWWVEPEHRNSKIGLELLQAFEYWAKKKKCKTITMVSLTEDLDKFYKKQGYTLIEHVYMKDVD